MSKRRRGFPERSSREMYGATLYPLSDVTPHRGGNANVASASRSALLKVRLWWGTSRCAHREFLSDSNDRHVVSICQSPLSRSVEVRCRSPLSKSAEVRCRNIKVVIRIGYSHGLVESTALRIDDTWSALKFSWPKVEKEYHNSYGTLLRATRSGNMQVQSRKKG